MPNYQVDPWPGYAEQSDDERIVTLEHKVGDARRRGDLLYAIAVCSAAAACEELERGGAGGETGVERVAKSLGAEIDKFGEKHLDDAGGWTPK
jgi:hypothetical protein